MAQQLLRRLAGTLSDGDLVSWSGRLLEEIEAEGPTFGADQESLADVLKRCSVAGRTGFGLSEDDLRWLLLRLASLQGPLPPGPDGGKFLVCRRFGKYLPAGSGIVSNCRRCGAQVVFPPSRIGSLRECDGALRCWRCARSFPGRVVEAGPR